MIELTPATTTPSPSNSSLPAGFSPQPAVPDRTFSPKRMARLLQEDTTVSQEVVRMMEQDPGLAEILGLTVFLRSQRQLGPAYVPFPGAPPGLSGHSSK